MLSAAHRGPRARAAGFTLIELMVTVSLLAVLLGLAAPAFSTWIRNTQVRATADALQNGLRLAQSESVRRNRQVAFSLTNAVPSASSEATANGSSWAIHTVELITSEGREFIQGGPLDAGNGVTVTGPAAICFNSAGRLTANASTGITGATCTVNAAAPLTRYTVSRSSAVSGSDRPLQVTVTLGGQVRMCDPARDADSAADGCPQ